MKSLYSYNKCPLKSPRKEHNPPPKSGCQRITQKQEQSKEHRTPALAPSFGLLALPFLSPPCLRHRRGACVPRAPHRPEERTRAAFFLRVLLQVAHVVYFFDESGEGLPFGSAARGRDDGSALNRRCVSFFLCVLPRVARMSSFFRRVRRVAALWRGCARNFRTQQCSLFARLTGESPL